MAAASDLVVPNPSRAFYLRWLVPFTLGLLIPLILFLLYHPFLRKAEATGATDHAAELAALEQRQRDLQNILLALVNQADRARDQCVIAQAPPVQVPTPAPAPPEPQPVPQLQPQPAPQPAPAPEPQPPPDESKKLEIPQDADKNDLSFLAGCWRNVTSLRNLRTNEPVNIRYCFDQDGRGELSVIGQNGQTCKGAARAKFGNDKSLSIVDLGRGAVCPDGSAYNPSKTICRALPDGSTGCEGQGTQPGNNNKWSAQLEHE